MRMLPSTYLNPAPALAKKVRSAVKHLTAPLKGLSLSSKKIQGDPLLATVLNNVVIEEDKVSVRAGTGLEWAYQDPVAGQPPKPVWALIPFYGVPNKYCVAIDGKLVMTDHFILKSGFISNDWHWTAFSNLSSTEFTVLVNGRDGVWSWEGNYTTPAVTVTSLSNTNPARCTVAAANIGKFENGMTVRIAGATGLGMVNANGVRTVSLVGTPANTFTINANTSEGAAPQTVGVTADPPGGLVKEAVTAPAGATHVQVNQMNIVLAHMNRLFFADEVNQSIFFLPLQQKTGELKEFPLTALFRRGGHIRALATWTRDGGAGPDDCLVIFSSNGEAIVYSGTDPVSDWDLVGIYRFDSPLSKHCTVNYGGDLYVLVSTGLLPMSTLVQSETEQLGQQDRNVFSLFYQTAFNYRAEPGWQVVLNPSSGRMICNLPQGAKDKYRQAVRFMPNPAWATWSALPSRCWLWQNNRMFFGSDSGNVYELSPLFLNDQTKDGRPLPIRVDIQLSWHNYNSAGIKHFKMLRPYIITDGIPVPFVDMKVNYDMTAPRNQPDQTSTVSQGAAWDVATWEEDPDTEGDYWAGASEHWQNWQGVAGKGYVGAPRIMVDVLNCQFSFSGIDVLYETGSVFG